MKTTLKRAAVWLLCAAPLVSAGGLPLSKRRTWQALPRPKVLHKKCVYGKAGETTFVPAGYTYILEGGEGVIYSPLGNL